VFCRGTRAAAARGSWRKGAVGAKTGESWTLWASSSVGTGQQRQAELKLCLSHLHLTEDGVDPSDCSGRDGGVKEARAALVTAEVHDTFPFFDRKRLLQKRRNARQTPERWFMLRFTSATSWILREKKLAADTSPKSGFCCGLLLQPFGLSKIEDDLLSIFNEVCSKRELSLNRIKSEKAVM
jgi:hypothetical protein